MQFKKRAPRAIKEVRKFATQHMVRLFQKHGQIVIYWICPITHSVIWSAH